MSEVCLCFLIQVDRLGISHLTYDQLHTLVAEKGFRVAGSSSSSNSSVEDGAGVEAKAEHEAMVVVEADTVAAQAHCEL